LWTPKNNPWLEQLLEISLGRSRDATVPQVRARQFLLRREMPAKRFGLARLARELEVFLENSFQRRKVYNGARADLKTVANDGSQTQRMRREWKNTTI
jgi:hypothetical protein